MIPANPTIDRESLLRELRRQLRTGQREIADWQGGKMAVSAVPGAGKSHGLAVAAAIVIARHGLDARKQLLVVTYTRSAAASIRTKIRRRLKDLHFPPYGFSVQTLHGLALQVATRSPGLSGLNLESSTLIVPSPGHRIVRMSVERWIANDPIRYRKLLEGIQFDGEETERLRRQSALRTEILPNLAHAVIREAKSSGLSPRQLRDMGEDAGDDYQILAIAGGLYEQYERLMGTSNFIDYDDMILAALRVLADGKTRADWRSRVFGVFEDEAQDSSPLQERLITLLAGDDDDAIPHLVRVGDPNQAINSTFTPADPVYFKRFCESCRASGKLAAMDRAGRSSPRIIEAANFVLEWVDRDWRGGGASESPFRVQAIRPVAPDDPQPNPSPTGRGLEIYRPEDIYQGLESIERRSIELFSENPHHNAAILVRENRQGSFLARRLARLSKEHSIRVFEANEVERFSKIPEEMYKLLRFVDRPHSPDNLKGALEILRERDLIGARDLNPLVTYPEQFLYPTPLDPERKPEEAIARHYCCGLLKARLELPHYQLLPFFAMTLKYTGSELATLQKLTMRIHGETERKSSIESTLETLNSILVSERFEGVEEDNDDRYTRPGQLTIVTMHKAKGLDWDYVFVPFLHEDILPGKPWVPVGAKFLGDFTLAEVARSQIRSLVHHEVGGSAGFAIRERPRAIPRPLHAWEEAARLKKAEEYRLLYVAMTRAKRLLWLSSERRGPFRWHTFREGQAVQLQEKSPCPVIPALMRAFPDAVVLPGRE